MYDSMFLMKQCIEKSGVTNKASDLAADRDRIRVCLTEVKQFPGIVGPITFNADGDAVLQPTVLRASGGKWQSLR